MTEYDCVIRGGTVATAADTFEADVGIRGGRIAALGEELAAGAREIDAGGRLVLPGGIDSHCHIDQDGAGGLRSADDFESGTRSAACGGTTTIIPFACQRKGQSLRDVVADYHARAEGKALVDYGFHLIVSDPTAQVLGQELPALVHDGYSSFKIYLTYEGLRLDDRQVLDILALARREGAMTMIHAENDDVITWLTERLAEAGRQAPRDMPAAHPAAGDREATHRAITLAEVTGAPALIVHVASAEAMDQIAWARDKGLAIFGETCPQYLFLTADDLDRPGFEGAKFMCSPPPRDSATQERLWHGLRSGAFQVFSSDHAPYRYDTGKRHHGEDAPFHKVANGVPGIELRLPLLMSEGVRKGRIDLNRFVALTATNHARIYGLYPRKGTIAVGADADIAIWDPEKTATVTIDRLHDNLDYTPYEGRELTGWPVTVLSRGDVVVEDGEPVAAPGRGEFLECGTPEPARAGTAFRG